jgi:type IV pilus assembly protein PilO
VADLSITKLPWKVQLALFVVVSLAAAGAFFYWYEMPARAELDTQDQELASIRARINKGLATARQLPEFRKEVDQLQARLDSLKPIIPDEKDAADLLRRIQTLAVQSNLVIRGFKPQPVTTKQLHAEWPIALQIEGNYHNLGLFLDRVSKFPRLINVSHLEIRGRDRDKPDPNTSIDVNCTATTFVLLNAAAKPAAGAAPAPKKTE